MWAAIWRFAGELALDPDPFTLGELVAMARAADEMRWWHTASILAMIANAVRTKGNPIQPKDMHPYQRAEAQVVVGDISALKALL